MSPDASVSQAPDVVERLKELTTSPYPPEPPRRSLLVDLTMEVSRRRSSATCITPHLRGGSAADKVQYEYEQAAEFWAGFKPHMDLLAGRDVLDIGCGWGGKPIYHAEHTQLRTITGFDLPGMVEIEAVTQFARSRGLGHCTFIAGYAEEMPVADESVDVAMMDDVLEHVADPEKTMAESWRVLRPGGLLLVKFPSIRMMQAHHFDRALTYPGLHYVASFRRWAGGLNDLLLRPDTPWHYEPFPEVVPTRFHDGLTRNLNGLDFGQFRNFVNTIGFRTEQLDLVPVSPSSVTTAGWLRASVYRLLWSVPRLREFLGTRVVFVGRRGD